MCKMKDETLNYIIVIIKYALVFYYCKLNYLNKKRLS